MQYIIVALNLYLAVVFTIVLIEAKGQGKYKDKIMNDNQEWKTEMRRALVGIRKSIYNIKNR